MFSPVAHLTLTFHVGSFDKIGNSLDTFLDRSYRLLSHERILQPSSSPVQNRNRAKGLSRTGLRLIYACDLLISNLLDFTLGCGALCCMLVPFHHRNIFQFPQNLKSRQ
jgi:hypothetical protein